MMRRCLLLLLALGLWQVAFAQVHCSVELEDCEEGACELCPLSHISPQVPDSALLCSLLPARRTSAVPSQRATAAPPLRRSRGRAPPL